MVDTDREADGSLRGGRTHRVGMRDKTYRGDVCGQQREVRGYGG